MNDLEYLHEFILDYSEEMQSCGGNLERTISSVQRICDVYDCREVNFFPLNWYITLSMKDKEGNYVSGQRCNLNGTSLNLERLSHLHGLYMRICKEKPEPQLLDGMLRKALETKPYQPIAQLATYLLIEASLSMLFDATLGEAVTILLNAFLIFLAGQYMSKVIYNRIVYSAVCTFVIGSVAIFMNAFGVAGSADNVMIVNGLLLLPGIPMVNAFRNLLTGNELNGLVELFKVVMETIAIVGGFVLSIYLFQGVII